MGKRTGCGICDAFVKAMEELACSQSYHSQRLQCQWKKKMAGVKIGIFQPLSSLYFCCDCLCSLVASGEM